MATNYGKKFESVIKESFEKVPNTSVTRLYDSTNGFLGVKTPCDFIVYHYPRQYMIECKSVHGNTLPFSNITDNQWNGLLQVSSIKGAIAGVLCWWIDYDITMFLPILFLQGEKEAGKKSVNVKDVESQIWVKLKGKKKRIFFDYDMQKFFEEFEDVW